MGQNSRSIPTLMLRHIPPVRSIAAVRDPGFDGGTSWSKQHRARRNF
ncbi:hypothetical protein SFOMI_0668 [Sphingobium fuliginis]|uniref:Uncharacterized protein n=1 Tax=Sphingobium fuliginis (strain ATCC 27551) TaxID=336203 RepID=A0A292ZB22_SPHSA|nr:hypothetical protein SFOMI_0668 [Sphingobium fuliginis]